jgi:hypothetical protein
MATDPKFDAIYEQIARRAATGNRNKFDTSALLAQYGSGTTTGFSGPTESPKNGWSLGQGIIDFLSTGSYFTAGVGKQIGEGVSALGRGDVLGGVARLNPIGLAAGGVVEGVNKKRSWSENLLELGADQGTASAAGLALDIAVDPLWLIPGGGIAAGIKGTARGLQAVSGANKAGVKFSAETFKQAGERLAKDTEFAAFGDKQIPLVTSKDAAERLSPLRDVGTEAGRLTGSTADLYQQGTGKISYFSGAGLSNLYQGVKQANIENYAEWAALRRVRKADKATRKEDPVKIAKFQQKYGINPAALIPTAPKVIDEVASNAARAADSPDLVNDIPNPAAEAAETIDKSIDVQKNTKVLDDIDKDANAVNEVAGKILDDVGAVDKSINLVARENLGAARDGYITSRKLPAAAVDAKALASVKASPSAGKIADEYDKLISNPKDPRVIAAYAKLSEEVADQFKYLTEELGVKVEFTDADPYIKRNADDTPVLNKDGDTIPDSKAMMEDVLQNKTLKVFKTADEQVHPILTKEINDQFRAVHDFFGHAASGRGFLADGEEAAWVSHSVMFSPLARRAMTTETRGQNSWVNKYATPEKKFADQKAGLLPDEYVLLPSEYSAVENVVLATNSLIGRTAFVLNSVADLVVDELSTVIQQGRGLQYTKESFASIQKSLEKVTESSFVRPGTKEHKVVVSTLESVLKRIDGNQRLGSTAEDLIKLISNLPAESANALSKVLNTPTDATDLISRAAASEGRTMAPPKPFKPTTWSGPQGKYGKPAFTMKQLETYFPDDPIFRDPKTLDLAMGVTPPAKAGVRAAKGETKEQALLRRQSRIWEDFRSRNTDRLNSVTESERTAWKTENSIPASDLSVPGGRGTVGAGAMPLNLPKQIFRSKDGRVITTLAEVIENISAMIIREPIRMVRGTGGLETAISSQIQKRVPVTRKKVDEEGNVYSFEEGMFPEDEIIEFATTRVRGAKFDVVGADNLPIEGWLRDVRAGRGLPAGSKLIPSIDEAGVPNAQAQQLIVRLKELDKAGRPMPQIDRMQPVVREWIVDKLKAARAAVANSNIRIARPINTMDEQTIAIAARKLMDENPAVKSFSDAKLFVSGFEDAMKMLSTKPKTQIFVNRDDLLPTRGALQPKVERTFAGTVKPGGEVQPMELDLGGMKWSNEDATLLTESGKQYTGRAPAKGAARDKLNRTYESQLAAKGKEKLASVVNAMRAIDVVAGAITAGQLKASPEQAQLFSGILRQLNINTAPDATPQQIFEMFSKNASLGFKDLIQGIEAAAKKEAVMYQTQKMFTMSVQENKAILEALEKTDPGELQRKVIRLTEDAVEQVNNACRTRYGTLASDATEFLERTVRGE